MNREIKEVAAGKVHYSSLLPGREHDEGLSKSCKEIGIQQPIIVRPLAGTQDEYEIIDGRGRRESFSDDEQIPVDIRHDILDSGVFRIAESTFRRKDRSACESALFYAEWLHILEKEAGSIEGLQQELANQTGLSESSLSQYLAIADLFKNLEEIAPNEKFSKLKTWGVNKLYKLSELIDDNRLVDLAKFFDMKFDVQMEEIEETVNSYKGVKLPGETQTEQQNPESGLSESLTPTEQQAVVFSAERRKLCLRNAKKVGSLAKETHETLDAIIQELMQDSDQVSSVETLQILATLLHTLRKLKKQSGILKQRIKPRMAGNDQ